MIIDFSGLPASGKSTFTSNFHDKYNKSKSHHAKIIDFIVWDRNTFTGKAAHTIMYQVLKCTSFSRLFADFLNELIGKKKPRFDSNHDIPFFVSRIGYYRFIYTWSKCLRKNLIVNEGISQSIVVLATEYDIDFEQLEKIVQFCFKNLSIYTISYNISTNEAFESFRIRNRHVNKIDNLDDINLVIFLETFDQKLEILSTILKSLRLNRNDGFEKNYDTLLKIVMDGEA